jgi:hypothetical protein
MDATTSLMEQVTFTKWHEIQVLSMCVSLMEY